MASLADVIAALDALAPPSLAYSWDRVGLQVDPGVSDVQTVVFSLDATAGTLEFARQANAQLVVSHHPLVWEPLSAVTRAKSPLVVDFLAAGIAVADAHTNWDCAPDGLNDALARALGLLDVRPYGSGSDAERLKVVVFAPVDEADRLIDAMAAAGAGEIPPYSRCAFRSPGTGTFIGGEASNPAVGRPGQVEAVAEARIEMLVPTHRRQAVLEAVLSTHSYETPAFDFYRLDGSTSAPAGRVGRLAEPLAAGEFAEFIDKALGTRCQLWQAGDRPLERVAVVGGAAGKEWHEATHLADVFLTGEVRHDQAVASTAADLSICQAGHYATEQPGVEHLAQRLHAALPAIQTRVYEPPPGQGGRPI